MRDLMLSMLDIFLREKSVRICCARPRDLELKGIKIDKWATMKRRDASEPQVWFYKELLPIHPVDV